MTPRSFVLIGIAMLALTGTSACASDDLGRLFFTPERRQLLDHQRQFNVQERTPPEEQTLTINGVVTRSSGQRTIWVNGEAQNSNGRPEGIAVAPDSRHPGRVLVSPDGKPPTQLKTGGTFNRSTGEASDVLGNGRISGPLRRPSQP